MLRSGQQPEVCVDIVGDPLRVLLAREPNGIFDISGHDGIAAVDDMVQVDGCSITVELCPQQPCDVGAHLRLQVNLGLEDVNVAVRITNITKHSLQHKWVDGDMIFRSVYCRHERHIQRFILELEFDDFLCSFAHRTSTPSLIIRSAKALHAGCRSVVLYLVISPGSNVSEMWASPRLP